MFGIGPQELLVIGLLILLVFGPMKAAGMVRDLGRFVNGANRTVEDLKSELVSDEVEEAKRAIEEVKTELVSEDDVVGGGDGRPRKPRLRKR